MVPEGDYTVSILPASATTCTGTALATGNPVSSFSSTLELLETTFGTPACQLATDLSSVASTNNGVNVRFRNAVPGFFNVHFAATPSGGAATNWFTNVAHNLAGISYVEKTVGTYSWQIRDALSPNTVRATSSNVVLGTGERSRRSSTKRHRVRTRSSAATTRREWSPARAAPELRASRRAAGTCRAPSSP